MLLYLSNLGLKFAECCYVQRGTTKFALEMCPGFGPKNYGHLTSIQLLLEKYCFISSVQLLFKQRYLHFSRGKSPGGNYGCQKLPKHQSVYTLYTATFKRVTVSCAEHKYKQLWDVVAHWLRR